MIEIEQRVKHARIWRMSIAINSEENYAEWCISMGLCETSGWINHHNNMLDWVKPGRKYI